MLQDPTDPGYVEPGGGWRWRSGAPTSFFAWASGAPDNASPGEGYARTRGGFDSANPGAWEDATNRVMTAPTSVLDWHIGAGQAVIFNTAQSTITVGQLALQIGNPGFPNDPQSTLNALFTPLNQVVVVGGVVEVRHFFLHAGGVLKLEGPNPFHLLAAGDVWIRGKLIADGGAAPNPVGGYPFGVLPSAPGGAGHAGGGAGGSGMPTTPIASASGAPGRGAFGGALGGGGGGETGWSPTSNANSRRGAGGGGGRLGADAYHPSPPTQGAFDQRRIGLDAEAGFDNRQGSHGALHGEGNPRGGAAGGVVFSDAELNNDFFGVARGDATGRFIVGELARPWAGSGGGGGGQHYQLPHGWPVLDSSQASTIDSFGGGGGGGAGSVRVTALGSIYFGSNGTIRARGGFGAGGANTSFLNRLGGGGGGGSGGHVILESALRIDLRATVQVNLDAVTDARFAIDARGGQGGPGVGNLGGGVYGANGYQETAATLDACPPGYQGGGAGFCYGHVDGAGGDGGPGIVQLHTPLGRIGAAPGLHDILLPTGGSTIDRTISPRPLAGGATTSLRLLSGAGGGQAVFELDSDDCDGDAEPDRYTIALDATRDANANGVLDDCEPMVAYCAAGTSSQGCTPALSWSGTPSASATSGFTLWLHAADGQRASLLFYGVGPFPAPFASTTAGAACVLAPIQRVAKPFTGGSAGACDGLTSVDWNAWRALHPQALGSPFAAGAVLFAQAFVRDGAAPSSSVFANAVKFTLTL